MKSKSSLIKKHRYRKLLNYNSYIQLWFNFHHLFFCSLIFRGKKISAFNNILRIKQFLKVKEDFDPFLIFLVSMLRMQPQIILVPSRKSGVINEIPFPITPRKQLTLAIRWLIKILRGSNSNRALDVESIGNVMISSIYNKGPILAKRLSVHKRAIDNKSLTKFLK